MTEPSWDAMWEIFHQARELPAADRESYLDKACGDDRTLREEVEGLLASDDGESGILEESPPFSGEQPLESAPATDSLIGSEVGPYRVHEILGEGGMGVVYGAVQESPMRRDVALKVLKLGMDTREVVARFESERQALALMNHPGIARVFDAGATESGRPYFAMERVRGIPITDYCDRHKLPVKERLKLFMEVCKAVHHAHQKAIIHRDIKPSNVLVGLQDGEPVAKVIDFGVAKAIDQRLTERTLYTELGRFIGTPEYMSPEQAEMTGLDVDTRTDIYSLGVLLFEILAGALPFDSKTLRRAGYEGIQRVLREGVAPRPSTRFTAMGEETEAIARRRSVDSASLLRHLRGDLDWIVLKSIEKDRTRRYASASELAADIERHLERRPIDAGPPGVLYRFGKFVQRHKLGMSAAAAVLVALLGGVAGTTYALLEAKSAQRQTEIERQKAEQVSRFLGGMLESAAPEVAQGKDTELLEELLADASTRIRDELGDQPEVAATLHLTLGETYRQLGLYDEAGPHLEKAKELFGRELGAEHRYTLAAETNLGLYLWDVGRYEESDRLTSATLETRRRVLGEDHPDTLMSMNNLALVFKAQGRYEEVERVHRRLLEIRRRTLGVENRKTVISMSNLGVLLRDQGRLDEAEPLLAGAVEVQRRVFGTDDPDTLISLDILGDILARAGRLDEAESLHLEALAGAERVLGPEHPSTLGMIYNLGRLQLKQGRLEVAEGNLRRALDGVLATVGESHRFAVFTRSALAECLRRRGDLEASREHFDRALEMAPQVLPPGHRAHVLIASKRAALQIDQGLESQGEEELLALLPRLEEAVGPDHEDTRFAVDTLIELYRRRGDDAKLLALEAKLAESG